VYGRGPAEGQGLGPALTWNFTPASWSYYWGPSGSGKDTLLNISADWTLPTAGELSYRGHRSDRRYGNRSDEFSSQNTVGFIFSILHLIPSLTARENVGLITEIFPGANGS